MNTDNISLKWGTLKSWNLNTETAKKILREYFESNVSQSAMLQRDTVRQKEIICNLIDACDAETIYLDWDDKDVSKEEAKRYVMEYR